VNSKKAIVLFIGALLGCFQIVFMFLSSGMGHGMSTATRLVLALYFGYGAILFFILPLIQYSAYFYVAYFKMYRAGMRLAFAHYLGTVFFLAYSIFIGNIDLSKTFIEQKFSASSTAIDLAWFIFLNFLYFKRVLSSKAQKS
jgi:hypothetical protein